MATDRRKAQDPGRSVAPVIRAILWRRSVRSYDRVPVEQVALDHVRRAAETCPSVDGRASGTVFLESEPDRVERLTRCITAGFVGKTNIWLRKANPQGYLVATGHRTRSVRQGERFFYNVDVALAGQAAVLAAAQHHVGTCWMAAIDEMSVAEFLALRPSERVVACIPLGRPRRAGQQGWNLASMWDRMANRLVSSRRKPFDEIHFLESFSSQAKLEPGDLTTLPTGGPDVVDLVQDLTPSATVEGGAIPDSALGWMVEACRQAPTADNSQIWRFVVVRERDRIGRLVRQACGADHGDLAGLCESEPSAVVVFASAPFFLSHRTREQPFFLLDVPIAMLHLLLLAQSLGYAWNALVRFDHTAVGRLVDLPEKHRVVAMVLLGEKGSQAAEVGAEQPWVQLRRPPR